MLDYLGPVSEGIGNTLLINGTVHSPPFRFTAIGGDELQSAFTADPLVKAFAEDADRAAAAGVAGVIVSNRLRISRANLRAVAGERVCSRLLAPNAVFHASSPHDPRHTPLCSLTSHS